MHPITALQTEYSLWTRHVEDEILPTSARARHRPGALLPARSRLPDRHDHLDRRPGRERLPPGQPRFEGDALAANLAIVEAVRAVADAKGATPGQIALAWVLAQGDDVVPIPGTKRVAYLEENVAAAAVELTADDLARIDDAVPAAVGDRYPDMSSIDA